MAPTQMNTRSAPMLAPEPDDRQSWIAEARYHAKKLAKVIRALEAIPDDPDCSPDVEDSARRLVSALRGRA